jgi:hypothetical protein
MMKFAVTCGGLRSVSAAGAAPAKWIGERENKIVSAKYVAVRLKFIAMFLFDRSGK